MGPTAGGSAGAGPPATTDEPTVVSFPDEAAPCYAISQVADMLAVQPAFLRRLDSHDVVSPARSAGDQRRYSRDDVRLISEVMALVASGYTLVAIRRVFSLQREITGLQDEVRRLRAARPR